MRTVVALPEPALASVREHARSAYPDECCGFLFARTAPTNVGPRRIVRVSRATNEQDGERHRRFLVRPETLRETERHASARGEVVAGFYHSHPDGPASPSRLDQENAWPGYTYLVIAVTSAAAGEVRAFELDPDARAFRSAALVAEVPPAPRRGRGEKV